MASPTRALLLAAALVAGAPALRAAEPADPVPTAAPASAEARMAEARALRDRAQVLAQRGLADLALDTYRRALEAWPAYPLVANEIGVLLARKGDLEGAAASLAHAVALDPEFAEAWANLAETERRLGRHADAVEHGTRFLALQPDDRDGYYSLASALLALGREGEALWALEQYLGRVVDPKSGMAAEVNLRAAALIKKGVASASPMPEAVAAPTPAPVDPGTPAEPAPDVAVVAGPDAEPGPLRAHSGDPLFAQRRYGAARAAYEQELTTAPRDVELLYKVGATAAVMGDYLAAVRWWQRALAVAPGRALIVRHLGLVAMRLAARGRLTTAPPVVEAAVDAARAALVAGQAAQAIALLQGVEDPEAIYLRGEAALALGLTDLARRCFEQLLAQNAADTAALGGRAEALLRAGGGAEVDTALEAWLGDRVALPEDFLVMRAGESASRIAVGPGSGAAEGDDLFDF